MHLLLLANLIGAHFLLDYPLQGDFLSRGKNPRNPIPGVPWYQCMTAHAFLQAWAVLYFTGHWELMVLEFVSHWLIDTGKCYGLLFEGELAFDIDQALHIIFKIAWWLIVVMTTR